MTSKRECGLGLRAFCAARWARARLSAMTPGAAVGWRVAVAVLVLMTATPAWAEDDSQEVRTRPVLNPGAPLPYRLGDLGDFRFDESASWRVAQAAGAPGREGTALSASPEGEGPSASELSRQLSNPVTSLWSLEFQFNNYQLTNEHWNNQLQFQPVLPVSLTKDLNLITRPVIPLYNIVQHETASGQFTTSAGLGDMVLLTMLSPANAGPWLLGLGPTFIFPTASSTFTGQGKWQAGPGAVAGYLTHRFIVGLFPQQWFSIGGDSDRPDTSQLNLQPFAAVFLGDGWDIGYSGNILANWKASGGNVWTVPAGLEVGKVVKLGRLPVKLSLAVQYMPVHPRGGQQWNFQLEVTPVIPKLIKGTLFE